MAWTDGPLVLYHGTDNKAATAIQSSGIDLSRGIPYVDFGQGFYTTTFLQQAMEWANGRCETINTARGTAVVDAAVLEFEAIRTDFDSLSLLAFVLPDSNADFWEFVEYCRNGNSPHRPRTGGTYDAVFGPVAAWKQRGSPWRRVVVPDYDQVSFHTTAGVGVLSHKMTHLPPGGPYFSL